jgi:mono/diheme cytochrome c family protein
VFRPAATIVVSVLASTAMSAHAEQPPAANYMLHCMGCHLPDGSGGPPDVPDVRGEMGRLLAVDGGREYLVQVPGASQAPISDAELAEVVNYMLVTFNSNTLPADYAPLTADEVARWREDWLPDVAAVRKELMNLVAEASRGEPETASLD